MLLMERAFFVGLTEHYAQSLCLLGRKLGIGQLSATGCATEIKVTHSDYGNKAGSTELSNEVLVRVRAITKIDQYAYGLALTLSRLVLEGRRSAQGRVCGADTYIHGFIRRAPRPRVRWGARFKI